MENKPFSRHDSKFQKPKRLADFTMQKLNPQVSSGSISEPNQFSLQYPPKKAQDTVSDTSKLRVKRVRAECMLSEAKECLYKLYSAS